MGFLPERNFMGLTLLTHAVFLHGKMERGVLPMDELLLEHQISSDFRSLAISSSTDFRGDLSS
jgi:hypothetical protein